MLNQVPVKAEAFLHPIVWCCIHFAKRISGRGVAIPPEVGMGSKIHVWDRQ